ncbi:DUF1206 domain-containing protein [Paraoerskovia marina]|uniref:DUF1206 domain-containing protein n=1 Tax=Paraoerskovia marina TaxID=545619 RepID=A0A1H1RZC2_9CELL|nr:DUF1206 domain-containing protein [Paraoerskovia marina]SDS41013.1 protein of unknown function [Paraoerskovia marina]
MNSASGAAQQANDSKVLQGLARAGFAVSGLLHLIVGGLVVKIALSSSDSGSADSSGAFSEIAQTPGGAFVLWFAVVAFAALALWQVTEAVSRGQEATDRAKAAGKAVLYGAMGFIAMRFATGSGSGGGSEESLTAKALAAPAGQLLVGAVGLAIIGGGVYHVYKGWKEKFREDLRSTGTGAAGKGVVLTGKIGYIAKGAALVVLGALFVWAALTADADKAGGMDDVFATIGGQPFGAVLLVAMGLGFAAYGLYSFARARFARM